MTKQTLLNRGELDIWFRALGNYRPFTLTQDTQLRATWEALQRVADDTTAILALGVLIEANDPDPEMPTGQQQESLFRLTKSFLDGYYSSLSQLCAVLNEFSNAFGRQFASKRNSQFLSQIVPMLDRAPANTFEVLDYARDFRAMLAHPSSFAPVRWMTHSTDKDDPRVSTLLFLGDGVPTGDTKRLAQVGRGEWLGCDWVIPAPNVLEVSTILRCVVEESLLRVADQLLVEANKTGNP